MHGCTDDTGCTAFVTDRAKLAFSFHGFLLSLTFNGHRPGIRSLEGCAGAVASSVADDGIGGDSEDRTRGAAPFTYEVRP